MPAGTPFCMCPGMLQTMMPPQYIAAAKPSSLCDGKSDRARDEGDEPGGEMDDED